MRDAGMAHDSWEKASHRMTWTVNDPTLGVKCRRRSGDIGISIFVILL